VGGKKKTHCSYRHKIHTCIKQVVKRKKEKFGSFPMERDAWNETSVKSTAVER